MTEILLVMLGALAGAWANNHLTVQNERKHWRFDVLKRCMAYRYDLKGDAFSTALNEAILVYASEEKVLATLRQFRAKPSNDLIEALLRAMAQSCDVRQGDLSSVDFLTAFNPR